MHREVLTKRAIELFGSLNRFPGFYLAGGTALALQIGHCVSLDYDLFSDKDIERSLLPRGQRVFSDETGSQAFLAGYLAWPVCCEGSGDCDPVSKRRGQCASGSMVCRVRPALRKKDADCLAAALAPSRPRLAIDRPMIPIHSVFS